jgi:hypothetical protein
MNSIVAKEEIAPAHVNPAFGALRFALGAIRSITWREVAYFLFLSLLVIGLNLAWLVEGMLMGKKSDLLMPSILMPLLVVPFVLCTWAIADRSSGALAKPWRLALGVMAGAIGVVVCVPPMVTWLGFDLSKDMQLEGDPARTIPLWSYWLASFLDVSFFTGIGVAVLETYRRRTRGQRALEAARQEQARLARELLESRLASMQAQVEPHFLFDSLVDVQATYDRDADHGANVMDRLITYLRVALPRLRESGSTVQAEVDLLAAYLAVVSARHEGRPIVRFTIAPECASLRFSPMLLLPLVQRAMRGAGPAGDVPKYVELVVRAAGKELIAQLRIEAPGLCADDPELARVRDRLAGLYDGRARLECEEPQPGSSQFTLCVPR